MISVLNNPWILIPLIAWTLFWKGIALWKSARRSEKGWFLFLLIFNTLGILEIIYIFLFAKKDGALEMDESQTGEPAKKKIV